MASYFESSTLIETLLTGNNLLMSLKGPDLDLLKPHIKALQSHANSVLYDPGQNVQTVYFPCNRTLLSIPVNELDECKSKSRAVAQLFARYADCLVA